MKACRGLTRVLSRTTKLSPSFIVYNLTSKPVTAKETMSDGSNHKQNQNWKRHQMACE